jgi:hypothetical protein
MKKNIPFLSLVLIAFLLVSCSNKVVFDEKILFPNANWAFEYKEIDFEVPFTGSDKPYSIVLELDLIGTPNVERMLTTFSILSPSGGEIVKPLYFNFDHPKEPYIQGDSENEKIYKMIVYPKRYFSETGTYKFIVDQYSTKADNYGIRSLRMYITQVKEEKKKN